MSVMRILLATAMLLLAIGLARTAGPATEARVPVVVELFTSEGCSSCPPADALLMDLDLRQPVAGAEIIALGEHVDYWNDLGWKDRFSSAQYSQRQSRYAAHFRLDSAYTPEMVINGRTEFVGNDSARAAKAIADAARSPAAPPAIAIAATGNDVDVTITNAGPHSRDVFLAITESDLSTQVGKGENHGRLLRHTAVVRELRRIGATSAGRFSARSGLKLNPEWRRDHLHTVIFLQDPATLEIAGAAQAALR
ncbi:MAG: DUF1223 domain-containing protein [Acidobacteriia bacterium]|nr:DUF1223 domain-containing protein [Terriglobia bacterium]